MLVSEQKTLFGKKLEQHKLPQTQYLGSKQKLLKWIFECAPTDIETIFDAFSGTSSVGYYFKTQGKRVVVNDFLKFNYHIGKAVIENKGATLTQEDIDFLDEREVGCTNIFGLFVSILGSDPDGVCSSLS